MTTLQAKLEEEAAKSLRKAKKISPDPSPNLPDLKEGPLAGLDQEGLDQKQDRILSLDPSLQLDRSLKLDPSLRQSPSPSPSLRSPEESRTMIWKQI